MSTDEAPKRNHRLALTKQELWSLERIIQRLTIGDLCKLASSPEEGRQLFNAYERIHKLKQRT